MAILFFSSGARVSGFVSGKAKVSIPFRIYFEGRVHDALEVVEVLAAKFRRVSRLSGPHSGDKTGRL